VSLRDRILQASDIKSNVLTVEQWGVDLDIRTMTARERSRLVSSCTKPDGTVDMEKMYPLLLIAAVYDPETGDKVFSAEDMESLQEKSASAIEFVAQKIMEVSGMNPKAVDEEGKGN
jgi:hypothetical protein